MAKAKVLILSLLMSTATAATLDVELQPGDYMLIPVIPDQPYTVVTIQSQPIDPPVLDTDGDGFADDADACPEVAGVAPDGCPDEPPDTGGPVALSLMATCDNAGEVWVDGNSVGSTGVWQNPVSVSLSLDPGPHVIAVRCVDQGGIGAMLASLSLDGETVVSDSSWRVSKTAPTGWQAVGFDDGAWASASQYGTYGSGPWYNGVSGFPSGSTAQWIWTSDSNADDEAYFRLTLTVDGDPLPPQPPVPPVSINDMAPGTWLEIPNSKLRESPEVASASEFPWVAQGEGISGIMNDWCGGAFDTKRDRLLIGPCGGHNGYYGNEVYAFDLHDLQWHRLTDPQPVTGECPDPALYPCAIHTYDAVEYIPSLDALVQVGGWLAPNTYLLDLETNTWRVFSPSNQGRTGDVAAWDADNGLLWVRFSPYAGSGKLYTWNPSTDEWVERSHYDPSFDYYATATLDPVRDLFVATGQHAGKVFTWPATPSTSGIYATAVETTGATAMTNIGNPGFEYHPRSGLLVAWDGGQSVYTLDLDTNVWTEHAASGADPGPADANGTYGRFRYVPSMGVFVVAISVDRNVFVYKPNFGQSPPLTSIQLDSPLGGEQPYTVGLGFKKGDVIAPAVDGAQVVVKRRWNDGSAKHAIVSGVAAMPAALSVHEGGGSSGPPMTATDIAAANPQASVQLGDLGSINLADLLHEPFRTWLSGPEMVEAHYRGALESGLLVWFHVRLYKNGQVWVRVSVENGFLDAPSSTKTYSANVNIGGTEVFADAEFTHYAHTRWTAEGWIGGDPQVTPKHDTDYLMASGLVPNYWKRNPSERALNNLYQDYSTNERGGWTGAMGLAGFQPQIGILPQWDALYVTSADPRAYRSVIANAKALNSFGIIWTDSVTGLPILPSERGRWTSCGEGQGGGCYAKAGDLSWEWSHHGSGGYLAYLLTGDYFHYETMAHQSARVYLYYTVALGVGTARKFSGSPRGDAWSLRTIGQLAAIGPDGDPLVKDYGELLSANVDYLLADQQPEIESPIPYRRLYDANAVFLPGGEVAPWMHNFLMQAGGYLRDIEPIESLSNLDAWLAKYYQGVVGLLGGSGQDNYCYTRAAQYAIKVAPVGASSLHDLYDSWGKVYEHTFGSTNAECGGDLTGSSAGHPVYAATGYWGNLLPAIAYAVDDDAEGAAEAWERLTSATNWSVLESSGFDDIPNWGVVPR